jgi:hypothetical protein
MSKPYERSYRRPRAMARLFELTGWLLVGAGVLGLLLGTLAGLNLFAGAEGAAGHLLGALPGLLVLGVGLALVQQAHGAAAAYDTAELTREILALHRRGAAPQGDRLAANLTMPAPHAADAPTVTAKGAAAPRPGGRAEPTLRAPTARTGS